MKVAAVVIVYNPPADVVDNIRSYSPDVDLLVVVDNSAHPDSRISGTISSIGHAVLEHQPKNVGIARALNIGADKALEQGCQYLLTMDQDSVAPKGMLGDLLTVADRDRTIGITGPFHLDRHAPDDVPAAEQEDVTTLMTSGSLVNLDLHRAIGGFREDFFIDYVDDEYCLRMKTNGYRVVRVNRVMLEHAQGAKTTENFHGRIVHPTHHMPERFYYQNRNRITIRRIHGHRFAEYFSYEQKLHTGRMVKMVLYERHKMRKILMSARGVLDGWRGRLGPLQPV